MGTYRVYNRNIGSQGSGPILGTHGFNLRVSRSREVGGLWKESRSPDEVPCSHRIQMPLGTRSRRVGTALLLHGGGR